MAGELRDLPPLTTFVHEIVRSLGEGTANIVPAGEWSVMAIAIGGQHLVLVRDHKWSLTISLPTKQSWQVQTRESWRIAEPQLKQAVSTYRSHHPSAVSMADVVLSIEPALTRLTGQPWDVSFPGIPVPSEAWLRSTDGRSVGLFQQNDSVLVVVWVKGAMRSQTISSAAGLASVAAWIPQHLVDQKAALESEAVEAARKRALPLPTIDDVLAALRAGKRFTLGGGRWNVTYSIKETKLLREVFDEGHIDVGEASEDTLRKDIKAWPAAFRS